VSQAGRVGLSNRHHSPLESEGEETKRPTCSYCSPTRLVRRVRRRGAGQRASAPRGCCSRTRPPRRELTVAVMAVSRPPRRCSSRHHPSALAPSREIRRWIRRPCAATRSSARLAAAAARVDRCFLPPQVRRSSTSPTLCISRPRPRSLRRLSAAVVVLPVELG